VKCNKILFICDWDYSFFWIEIAKKLKQQGFVKQCTALSVGKIYYNWLNDQLDSPFDQTHLLQAGIENVTKDSVDFDYLSQLEEQYGKPTLWRYVWADRSWNKLSYKEICIKLEVCFRYYEKIYSTEKPDFIVTNGYGSMPHLVSFEVAKRLGIPVFRHMSIRLGNKYIFDNSIDEDISGLLNPYLNGEKPIPQSTLDEVDRFIESFNRGPEVQDITKKVADVQNKLITKGKIFRFFRYMYRYWGSKIYANDHTQRSPFVKLYKDVAPGIQRKIYAKKNIWEKFVPDEKYVYFPLHLQPEATTMLLAPFYLNQLSVIENLSKAIPVGYRLVIKEHPNMLGARPMSFYRRLKHLPNVRLIHPFENGFEVVKHAALIFTLTGTAGLEGLLMKKPVIVLGETYYRLCPLIYCAEDVSPVRWGDLISDVLKDHQHDDKLLKRFLAALFMCSFEGQYFEPLFDKESVLSEQNLENYANVLRDAIEERFLLRGAD